MPFISTYAVTPIVNSLEELFVRVMGTTHNIIGAIYLPPSSPPEKYAYYSWLPRILRLGNECGFALGLWDRSLATFRKRMSCEHWWVGRE